MITIHYTDQDGKENESVIHYDPTRPGCLRFKHQTLIEWKLVERRPSEEDSHPLRWAVRGWWEGMNVYTFLALLGIAVTSSAILWRRRALAVKESGALVENVDGIRVEIAEGASEPRRGQEAVDWEQAPAAVPPAVAEQRRSERILLKIPVQVAGIDIQGASYREPTFTISISRHGAFIWLKNSPRLSDPVSVTNLGTRESCLFRLCERDKGPTSEVTAWGIECLEPDSNFWQIRFPEKAPEPSQQKNITTLIVCTACHSREVAELSVAQYHDMLEADSTKRECSDCGKATEWRFILVEATGEVRPEEIPGAAVTAGEDHRREKRIVAKLPIRLRHPADGREESTQTENVSKLGLCCAASMELDIDDVIFLAFESGTGPSEEENRAQIRWRHPMGENRRILYGISISPKPMGEHASQGNLNQTTSADSAE